MTVPSARVVTVLTAAAVISIAGLVSISGHGASAQPATKPTQPTQPVKPDPQPAKPDPQPAKPNDPPPPPPPTGPGGEKRPDRGPGGERGPGGPGDGSIEGAMKGMNRAVKQLQGQIGDVKKKDENLRLMGSVERNCIAAKDLALPPEMLETAKDDAEKAKLADSYRKHLIILMRKLLDLELFVIDGKTDAANAKLLEIVKYRDATHEEFGIKDNG